VTVSIAGCPLDRERTVHDHATNYEGGQFTFKMSGYVLAAIAEDLVARVEIFDANTGKIACFPDTLGTASKWWAATSTAL
jgi:hypothetical protein